MKRALLFVLACVWVSRTFATLEELKAYLNTLPYEIAAAAKVTPYKISGDGSLPLALIFCLDPPTAPSFSPPPPPPK